MLHEVKVTVFTRYPACEDKCSHSRECANHTTAGDFRSEDGLVPDLRQVAPDCWRCSKQPKHSLQGAILTDGSHMNDEN